MLPTVVVKPTTSWSLVRSTSKWATEASNVNLVDTSNKWNLFSAFWDDVIQRFLFFFNKWLPWQPIKIVDGIKHKIENHPRNTFYQICSNCFIGYRCHLTFSSLQSPGDILVAMEANKKALINSNFQPKAKLGSNNSNGIEDDIISHYRRATVQSDVQTHKQQRKIAHPE